MFAIQLVEHILKYVNKCSCDSTNKKMKEITYNNNK